MIAYREASSSRSGRTTTSCAENSSAAQRDTSVIPAPAATSPHATKEWGVSTMTFAATPAFENASSIW